MRIRILIIFSAGLLLAGCSYKNEQLLIPENSDCSSVNSSFSAAVQPILQTHCALGSACHGNGSVNGPGTLTSYTNARNAALSIKDAVITGRMPMGSTLTAQQKQTISCWVDSGAPNN